MKEVPSDATEPQDELIFLVVHCNGCGDNYLAQKRGNAFIKGQGIYYSGRIINSPWKTAPYNELMQNKYPLFHIALGIHQYCENFIGEKIQDFSRTKCESCGEKNLGIQQLDLNIFKKNFKEIKKIEDIKPNLTNSFSCYLNALTNYWVDDEITEKILNFFIEKNLDISKRRDIEEFLHLVYTGKKIIRDHKPIPANNFGFEPKYGDWITEFYNN